MDVDVETMRKKKIPVPDAARLVSAWALLTACVFLASFALACYHVPWDLCVQSTNITGMVYYAATQAAVAALALLLPGRHLYVRTVLADLALVLTIVVHIVLMMAAETDHTVKIYWTIVFMAGDSASFLAVFLGGEED